MFHQVLDAFENPSVDSLPIYGTVGLTGFMIFYIFYSFFQRMNKVNETYHINEFLNEKVYMEKDNDEFFKQLD